MANIQNIEVGQVGKYYQMTSLATAKDVPGIHAGSGPGCRVLIQALGQNVRYIIGGGTPTGTVGVRLHATETHTLNVAPGTVIKVIEEATSAEVNVQVFN